MKTEENIELWKKRFSDQKKSGLKVGDWCKDNGLSKHAYYYWQQKIKISRENEDNKIFEEIPAAVSKKKCIFNTEGISVRWNDFSFFIHDHDWC